MGEQLPIRGPQQWPHSGKASSWAAVDVMLVFVQPQWLGFLQKSVFYTTGVGCTQAWGGGRTPGVHERISRSHKCICSSLPSCSALGLPGGTKWWIGASLAQLPGSGPVLWYGCLYLRFLRDSSFNRKEGNDRDVGGKGISEWGDRHPRKAAGTWIYPTTRWVWYLGTLICLGFFIVACVKSIVQISLLVLALIFRKAKLKEMENGFRWNSAQN